MCVWVCVCVSNIMCVNIQTPIFQGFFLTSKTIEADEWWLCQALKSLQGLVCVMCLPVAYGVCVFMREWQLTVKPWPVFLVLCAIKHRLAFRKPGNQCVSATSLTHGICSHPTHLFIIFLWGLATLQGKKKTWERQTKGWRGNSRCNPKHFQTISWEKLKRRVSLNKAIFFCFMLKLKELANITLPFRVISVKECTWVHSCEPERKSNTNITHNGHLSLSFRQSIIFWRETWCSLRGRTTEKKKIARGAMIHYYMSGIRDYFTSHPGCVVVLVTLVYLSHLRI